jgi:hypothetical protein
MNEALQGNNLTDRVKGLGLTTASNVRTVYDINPAIGGPIQRDRIWFFSTGRYNVAQNYVGGMFHNRNENDATAFAYVPDTSRRAFSDTEWWDAQTRLTMQASLRNKFAFTYDQQARCSCPWDATATRSPEAGIYYRFPQERLLHGEWSSPVTSRLLLEAVALQRTERWGAMHPFGETWASGREPGAIRVTEQGGAIPGLQFNGRPTYNNTWLSNVFWRFATSYVTGSHAFRLGINDSPGYQTTRTYNFVPLEYRFNNGVPNQLTQYATPYDVRNNLDHDLGIFAQDRFTLNRLTVTAGVRFDWFQNSFGEGNLYSGPLVPGRSVTFEAQDNVDWKDITPRLGAVYDLRGDGKTALKVTLNKYLGGIGLNGLATDPNPVNAHASSASRAWNDLNRNFVPDCDLTNPSANGECAQLANPNFGRAVAANTFDPDLLTGWGQRYYNWEFSVSGQHEILPRVSVDIGYFRRWFGNFRVTDNLAVSAADYETFTVTAPSDPRLPGGGGYAVTGIDLRPSAFGRPLNNYNTLSDKYGKWTEHWNGMDFLLNARLQSGMLLQGGVSTGRTSVDACGVTSQVPEMLIGPPTGNQLGLPGFTGAGFNLANTQIQASDCAITEQWLTQAKLVGIFTVPKVGVLVSGTYQNMPGPSIAANYVVGSAAIAGSLGRPLSGGTPNATINVVTPGSMYGDRINQLDLRFSRGVRFGGSGRITVNVDLANVLNADTVVTEFQTYNPANTGAWRRPNEILQARFLKLGFNLDF